MITRTFLSAVLCLSLPGLSQAAGLSRSMGEFQASITIVAACSAQQAMFGSQSQGSGQQVTVICQPGMTPFLTQSIDLGAGSGGSGSSPSSASQGGTSTGAASTPAAGPAFDLVSKNEVLSPPLPSASTFASKVIYVMF
ncbi:hypothetical protein KVP10_14010 [Candidimonas humi]|uniref:Spore coat protein U (SCPU) domain-containing protein n=1 Tax=Candidimonas humi TaxID=683355 RepID=A0ABV8NUP5_9BURK|nr:hypothetical protein [Candidimonas humi]MBV6306006.1 hypothetical protein [Candidimonas humi]